MAIAIDGSTPIRFTGTPANAVNITSAAFTAPSGALLVCCVNADTAGNSNIDIAASDTGGLTWTQQAEADEGTVPATTGGHASVWTATTVSAVSRTVSVQRSSGGGNSNRISVKCYVVTGQHASPIGAVGQNFSATNDLTAAIFTSTAASSFAFVAGTDWEQLGTPTSSDLTIDTDDFTGVISVMSGYKDCAGVGAETANLNAGGTAAAGWTWAALEVKAAAAAAVVLGWQHATDDFNPRPPIRFHPPAAIALTPDTLPPKISGMAWSTQMEPVPSRRWLFADAQESPAFGPPVAAPITFSTDWESGEDDLTARKFRPLDIPTLIPTPNFLPPQINGIAWFGNPDPLPRPPPKQQPASAITLAPPALLSQLVGTSWQLTPQWLKKPPPPADLDVFISGDLNQQTTPISGMAWFEPPDIFQPRPLIRQPTLAVVLIRSTLPPQISGMAWFKQPDVYQLNSRKLQDAPSFGLPYVLQVTIVPLGWPSTPMDVYQPRRWYVQDWPVLAMRSPPTQLIGVPWMTWLDLLSKPTQKQQPAPAVTLTPDTLPVPVSGMGWFIPPDGYEPRRFYHPLVVLQDANSFGLVFIPNPPAAPLADRVTFTFNFGLDF